MFCYLFHKNNSLNLVLRWSRRPPTSWSCQRVCTTIRDIAQDEQQRKQAHHDDDDYLDRRRGAGLALADARVMRRRAVLVTLGVFLVDWNGKTLSGFALVAPESVNHDARDTDGAILIRPVCFLSGSRIAHGVFALQSRLIRIDDRDFCALVSVFARVALCAFGDEARPVRQPLTDAWRVITLSVCPVASSHGAGAALVVAD